MTTVVFQSMGNGKFLVTVKGGRLSFHAFEAYRTCGYYDNLRGGRVTKNAAGLQKLLNLYKVRSIIGEPLYASDQVEMPFAPEAEAQAAIEEVKVTSQATRWDGYKALVQAAWMAGSPKIRSAEAKGEEEAIAGIQRLFDMGDSGKDGKGFSRSTRQEGIALLACYEICQQLTDDQWLAARSLAYFHRRQLL